MWLRDKEADPQIEVTPDSSVHRCREETGADPVPRYEVPQVERRQKRLDQGALLEEVLGERGGCWLEEKGKTDYQPRNPPEATNQMMDPPW